MMKLFKKINNFEKKIEDKYGGMTSTFIGAVTGGILGKTLGVTGSIAGLYFGASNGILPLAIIGGIIAYLIYKVLKYKSRVNSLKRTLKKNNQN